jgi:hypothetical protein
VILQTCGGINLKIKPGTLEIQGLAQLGDAITNAVATMPARKCVVVSTNVGHLYILCTIADEFVASRMT